MKQHRFLWINFQYITSLLDSFSFLLSYKQFIYGLSLSILSKFCLLLNQLFSYHSTIFPFNSRFPYILLTLETLMLFSIASSRFSILVCGIHLIERPAGQINLVDFF